MFLWPVVGGPLSWLYCFRCAMCVFSVFVWVYVLNSSERVCVCVCKQRSPFRRKSRRRNDTRAANQYNNCNNYTSVYTRVSFQILCFCFLQRFIPPPWCSSDWSGKKSGRKFQRPASSSSPLLLFLFLYVRMSYYKDRLGFDPDEPAANGDGTTFRKSKRGYEENLCKFKGLSCSFLTGTRTTPYVVSSTVHRCACYRYTVGSSNSRSALLAAQKRGQPWTPGGSRVTTPLPPHKAAACMYARSSRCRRARPIPSPARDIFLHSECARAAASMAVAGVAGRPRSAAVWITGSVYGRGRVILVLPVLRRHLKYPHGARDKIILTILWSVRLMSMMWSSVSCRHRIRPW